MAFNEDYKWVMFDTWTVEEQVDPKSITANPSTLKYIVNFVDQGEVLVNTANIQSISEFYNKQTNRFENNRLLVSVGMFPVNVIGSLQDFQSNYLPPDTTP
tara:strand:- start:174 stop:476 length:303 start_codon:yes stop_codon:yes gene_type:complete